MRRPSRVPLIGWLGVILLVFVACSSGEAPSATPEPTVTVAPIQTAPSPVIELPPAFKDAPAEIREAYLFALEQPDVLMYIPCYCGCESAGHTSNLDCFVKEIDAQGRPVLDNHGYG